MLVHWSDYEFNGAFFYIVSFHSSTLPEMQNFDLLVVSAS